jgi:hypothetical protein
MDIATSTGSSKRTCHRTGIKPKAFSLPELLAKERGQNYLQLAQSYHARNDLPNAVSCCLEGFEVTYGVSRPLVVRDQLHDLLDVLDPNGTLASLIRTYIGNAVLHQPTRTPRSTSTHTSHVVRTGIMRTPGA